MFRLGICLALVLLSAGVRAQVQAALQTSGTLVVVPAFGEVRHANDEAHLTLMIEEQAKDKATAASRVNQKMKQGTDIVKRQDPQATLKTRGYYTYPVYPEDQQRQNNKASQPVSWRVGQFLEVTTMNLSGLPQTVAAVQPILALRGLYFGLSEVTGRKLDQQRIEATYNNLTERIASVAKSMGRNVSDAVLDTVDFEGSGAYIPQQAASAPMIGRLSAKMQDAAPVEEPSFEPGETTLQMRAVGKIKFK